MTDLTQETDLVGGLGSGELDDSGPLPEGDLMTDVCNCQRIGKEKVG